MTLADIGGDIKKNSHYYAQKVADFYSELGMDNTELGSDYLELFFNYIEDFDGKSLGLVNQFLESIPSSEHGVLGYTGNWKGTGHAMPLYKMKVQPNKQTFKLYFSNHVSTFLVTNANYHTYGFVFWDLIVN